MPKIYDNIENHLNKGLTETLEHAQRTDFCVGYFYLSWKEVADKIESLAGATVTEGNEDVHRICRLLVGMHKMPMELIRDHYSKKPDELDMQQGDIPLLKKKLAQQFKEQLTMGTPTDAD
jgi:hypothetical protein